MIHPSPDRIRQLTERWTGQDARLQRIAEAMLAGEDWTEHLRGLPFRAPRWTTRRNLSP